MANTPFHARHGLRLDTGSSLFAGNTVANLTFSSVTWSIANSLGSATFTPGSIVVTVGSNTATLIGSSLAFGNATVNGSYTSTSIGLANSSGTLTITPTALSYAVGGSLFVGNSVANSKILYNSIFVGNSIANVSITPGSLLVNGVAVGTGSWNSSNDGAGSGLDADLLDGLDSTAFSRLNQNETMTGVKTYTVGNATTDTNYASFVPNDVGAGKPALYIKKSATANVWSFLLWDGSSAAGAINVVSTGFYHLGQTIWHAGNDGSGTGLDADLLDGYDSAAFARLAGTPTFTSKIYISGVSNIAQIANTSGSIGQLEIQNGSSGAAAIAFHRAGAYAAYFGLDTDNVFKVGGWSMGGVSYKLWHEGNDGSGTGLDADTVDGYHASSLYKSGDSPTFGTVTATAYNTSSDQSLKSNIEELPIDVEKLRSIMFRSFVMSNQPERLRAGVIAQELEPILPHLVTTDLQGLKAVDYVGLSVYFMKYCQDLDHRVNILEQKVDKLISEGQ